MTRIRIRSKPKRPVRKKEMPFRFELFEGISLADVVEAVPANAEFDVDWEDDYDIRRHLFVWKVPESDADFAARQKVYGKKLADYNAWYKANKDYIEDELDRRDIIERKKLEAQEKKLLRELSLIQKQKR